MQHKIELEKVTIVKVVITALLEELHKLRTFCVAQNASYYTSR